MLNSLFEDVKVNLQFLSRMPVRGDAGDQKLPEFQKTAYTFPLAGLLIGLPAGLVLWGASVLGLSSIVSALLSIITLIVITGALHEDGLADVVDGFWGGHTKERKLEIMRDSSIGTYGALALLLSVALRIGLLSSLLIALGPMFAAAVVVSTASLSRFAMLQPWNALQPARDADIAEKSSKNTKDPQGLSKRYGSPDLKTVTRGVICALPAMALLLFSVGAMPFIIGLIAFEALVLLSTRLSEKHIGGHTGDTLGATQQISELGLLLGLAIAM